MKRLSNIEENSFRTASACHTCELYFEVDQVSFHQKISGSAHNSCNINDIHCLIVPIVFHILGYDENFIIRDLATSSAGIISLLGEIFCFTKYQPNSQIKFRFIDFFRFLSSKLETLVGTLKRNKLNILKNELAYLDNEKFNLTNYNPSEPSRYLLYYDINSLYGRAMSQYLPYAYFQWVEDIENFNLIDT